MPAFFCFRLMIAWADGKQHIVSTTNFDVAYHQTENRDDHTTWVLISFKNPISGKTEHHATGIGFGLGAPKNQFFFIAPSYSRGNSTLKTPPARRF